MNASIYIAIAQNLREFGYPDVTAKMIEETDEARRAGKPKDQPHGIISMFANRQLEDVEEQVEEEERRRGR